MLDFSARTDIDNSNLLAYPDGAIKDNTGIGDGTAVNRAVYNDLYQAFLKLARLYGITPNGLPDNETNGFQYVDAIKALASKNDYRYTITLVSGALNVPVKLSFMQNLEYLICIAGLNQGAQTQIRGLDNVLFNFTGGDTFKNGDLVLIVKSGGSFILRRLVSGANFGTIADDLGYLKAASNADEDTGTSTTVATTPGSNEYIFERRVNGIHSDAYLATPSQNGLLSLEDKAKIDAFDNGIVNRGEVSGIDPAGVSVGASLPSAGDISAALVTVSAAGALVFRITLANAMPTIKYKLDICVETLGTDLPLNSRVGVPIFKPFNLTQCDVCISEFGSGIQNLKFHIDAIKL